ncbi:hypothetical protein N2152v2_008250 [Parachlorella kessleri]
MAQLHEAYSAPASQWLVGELCFGLGALQLQQQAPTLGNSFSNTSVLGMAASPAGCELGGVNAAALLLDPSALQQLAAVQVLQAQQQPQVALPAMNPEALLPLLNLSNMLAAQSLGTVQNGLHLLDFKEGGRRVGSCSGGRVTGAANPLYKTELCRSWEEMGSCRYGGKCQFAHGREELRPIQRHPKYKTEICRTFAQTGTCPYGTRCRFIHHDATLASLKAPTAPAACIPGACADPYASREGSASSLSTLLSLSSSGEVPSVPRSPTLAGLMVGPNTSPLPMPLPLHPLSPTPVTNLAATGSSTPTSPPATNIHSSSAAAAAAALANLLSMASAQQSAGGAGAFAPTPAGLSAATLPPFATAGQHGAYAAGQSAAGMPAIASSGLAPTGPLAMPPMPSVASQLSKAPLGNTLAPSTAAAALGTPTLLGSLPAAGLGLASAPSTPTATHPGSRLVRRISSDNERSRLPIFTMLTDREDAPVAAGFAPDSKAAPSRVGSGDSIGSS